MKQRSLQNETWTLKHAYFVEEHCNDDYIKCDVSANVLTENLFRSCKNRNLCLEVSLNGATFKGLFSAVSIHQSMRINENIPNNTMHLLRGLSVRAFQALNEFRSLGLVKNRCLFSRWDSAPTGR